MRQIRLLEPGRLEQRDVARPVAGRDEALVRVHRVGICGTDFHAFDGTQVFFTYPRVLGHELSCEVLEAPPNDRGIRAGDRCAVEPYVNCGSCRACRLDRGNCCENIQVLGVHRDGGMQGLFAVPLRLLHKSGKLSHDQLALVEPLSIGAHAVARSGLKEGEGALVVGAGPIGLSVMQFARAAGANVAALEVNESRHAFAQKFGFRIAAEPPAQLADVVFDATGNAASMSAGMKYVAPAGRLVFVGITRQPVTIDDPLFHAREITLLASRNSRHQFPCIIRMMEEGKIDTAPWITDRLRLEDVPQRLPEIRKQPATMKAMIEVDDADVE